MKRLLDDSIIELLVSEHVSAVSRPCFWGNICSVSIKEVQSENFAWINIDNMASS